MVQKSHLKIMVMFCMLTLSALACQKAFELLTQVGYELEEEFGEGSGWDAAFPDDGPNELSSFCKSLLPMGIFMQEAEAEGAIYPDEVRGLGGTWVQCVFQWEGDGVWCEWGFINHEEPVSDCLTTPDPDRNRERETCVEHDRVNGEFCGEYDGVSITGIVKVVKVEKRYVLNGGRGSFEHSEQSFAHGGVMSCNVMANGTCAGTWSAGDLNGDWWITLP